MKISVAHLAIALVGLFGASVILAAPISCRASDIGTEGGHGDLIRRSWSWNWSKIKGIWPKNSKAEREREENEWRERKLQEQEDAANQECEDRQSYLEQQQEKQRMLKEQEDHERSVTLQEQQPTVGEKRKQQGVDARVAVANWRKRHGGILKESGGAVEDRQQQHPKLPRGTDSSKPL